MNITTCVSASVPGDKLQHVSQNLFMSCEAYLKLGGRGGGGLPAPLTKYGEFAFFFFTVISCEVMFDERTIHKLAPCVGINPALFLSSRTDSYCHVITISTLFSQLITLHGDRLLFLN